jgi:hypothetical protein
MGELSQRRIGLYTFKGLKHRFDQFLYCFISNREADRQLRGEHRLADHLI